MKTLIYLFSCILSLIIFLTTFSVVFKLYHLVNYLTLSGLTCIVALIVFLILFLTKK